MSKQNFIILFILYFSIIESQDINEINNIGKRNIEDDINNEDIVLKGSSPFKKETKKDKTIILTPKSGNYNYVLIFLHGLFQTPQKIVSKFDKSDNPLSNSFKIILPAAPVQKCSPAGGKKINSWFNVYRNGPTKIPLKEEEMDLEQYDASSQIIKNLVIQEASKINGDYSRIFVGGFSQGACLTYDIGLSFNHLLGGIFSLCGIPFKHTKINKSIKDKLNICIGLANFDEYFPLEQAKNTIKHVIGNAKKMKIKEFFGSHELTNELVFAMEDYIKNKLI